jgi:hypothetical protein
VARHYGGLLAKGSSLRQPSSLQSRPGSGQQATFGPPSSLFPSKHTGRLDLATSLLRDNNGGEIVKITEFSYDELLQPAVLYAPLYAELESDDRQRMIVRTFFKEALASFIRVGLGPANTLGPKATRQLARLCAFSAGVVLGLPASSLQFIDYTGLLTHLQNLVREGGGAGLRRVWTELTTVVIALGTTIGMEGVFYSHRPRKSSGGGSSN